MKYVDPDGKYAYSVEIRRGEFVLQTSPLKEKLFYDAYVFVPFGGTMLTLINKGLNIKDLNSSEFDSIKNELEMYWADFYGNIGDFCDSLEPLSKTISNLATASSILSMLNDIFDSKKENSDTDIDSLTSEVFTKLCNYTISGKSHESVAKKYFIAKTVVKDLLDKGKLKYSKDWKNDITSIHGNDRNTLKMLRALTKQLKTMDE